MTVIAFGVAGCATERLRVADPSQTTGNLRVGRVITVRTGE